MIFTKTILTDEERHGIVRAFRRAKDENDELKGSPRTRVEIQPRITFPDNLNAESQEWLLKTGKQFGVAITFQEANRPMGNEGG